MAAIAGLSSTSVTGQSVTDSTFTYQGQLKLLGAPTDGLVDFEFALWNAEFGGAVIGVVDPYLGVEVVDGLFTVQLDFGGEVFKGKTLWLNVAVRYPHDPSETEPFTTLNPRQPLTAVPFAIQTRGLFVDQTLNVGIGTLFPSYPLEVETVADRAVSATSRSPEGRGVNGLALADSGVNYGVFGQTSSSEGHGVYGWASATGGMNYGVYGLSWSTSGHGVYGLATASSGTNYGVYGRSVSDQGTGVYGEAGSSAGETAGVTGRSLSADGTGVLGFAHALSGANFGVRGWSRSDSGRGVYGWASASSGTNYGVYGRTDSPEGYSGYFKGGRNYFEGSVGIGVDTPSYPLDVVSDADRSISAANNGTGYAVYGEASGEAGSAGVIGWASATSGTNHGGRFQSDSTSGYAVHAVATATSGTNYAVYGETKNSAGYAGYFKGGKTCFLGLVGIGTESPSAALDVKTSGYAAIRGETSSSGGRGVHGRATRATGANFGVYGETSSPDGYAGYFTGGKSYFEGHVGIGTDSPSAKLELGGPNANIKMYEDGGSPFVEIGDDATAKAYLQWWSPSDRLLLYTSGHSYPMAIGPTGTGGIFVDTEANGGEVGIGTESPQARLQVDAPTGADPFRVRINGGTKLIVNSNGNTAVGANSVPAYQLQIFGAGTAGKPGGGSWASSSDRRLKKHIRDLEGSLEKLMRLRGVSFEYKDPEAINELSGTRIGMVAQEVEAVFPDWVSEGGHGYKTLSFRGFEALTVEALRELREEQDRELRDLRARNAQLESRMAELEAIVAGLAEQTKATQ